MQLIFLNFVNFFISAFSVISTICNGTLVALILRYEKKNEFGAYRYLLLTFAIVDLYYGWVHFLIQPVGQRGFKIYKKKLTDSRSMGERVLYGGSRLCNRFDLLPSQFWKGLSGKIAVCFYATAHSHSFVVLVFHFLYRLLAVRGLVRLIFFHNARCFPSLSHL